MTPPTSDKPELTSFVIRTSPAIGAGKRYEWTPVVIDPSKIVTGPINLQTATVDRDRLVSGVPTPFARVELFREALARVATNKDGGGGALDEFYAELVGEWKGLIGLFAVSSGSDIRVERVRLTYPNEAELSDPDLNLFDMRGSLGAMLFDSKDMWKDPQEEPKDGRKPFIDVIFYGDQVIGATSPEVLVFTGVHRELPQGMPFVSEVTKRLDDPLKSARIQRQDLVKLFHFVKNMEHQFDEFHQQFKRGDLPSPRNDKYIPLVLKKWLEEIRAKLGPDTSYERSPKPTFTAMKSPFSVIFHIENKLWGLNGNVSMSPEGVGSGEGALKFVPDELLLHPDTATVLEIPLTKDDAVSLGVHLLKVDGPGGARYFTLPLSPVGLVVLENVLPTLLSGDQPSQQGQARHRMFATIDDKANELKVTLVLSVDGIPYEVERIYRGVEQLQSGGRVICWPDFVHRDWQEYYLYSEVPHNGRGIQAFPLRGDEEAMRLMRAETSEQQGVRFASAYLNGKEDGPGAGPWDATKADSIELIIGWDLSKLTDADFPYEIYKSKRPFKGLEFKNLQRKAGFIIFKAPEHVDQGTLSDLKRPRILRRLPDKELKEVRVGVDFGSNNTCISYAITGEEPKLVKFSNRRRFLLGRENEPVPGQQVTSGELFFFQNEEPKGNEIKSMVTIHDVRRIVGLTPTAGQNARLGRAVIGGIPFFEKNVPVGDSLPGRHSVKFGEKTAEVLYNMKWSQDDREVAHQQAFLRTLWLKVWAELFEEGRRPDSLVWAVPSAMSDSLRAQYQARWNSVVAEPPVANVRVKVAEPPKSATVTPANSGMSEVERLLAGGSSGPTAGGGLRAMTESNAVSRYAAFVRENTPTIDNHSYHIGLDVGGSTTDFLCLVVRDWPGTDRKEKTLIKEGSIRIAAGSLAEMTSLSKGFKNALEQFCFSRPNLTSSVAGVTQGASLLTPKTAPYYYNLVLDRMEEDDFQPFYTALRKSCPELFIVNAFLTGFIQFHAGQLAYNVQLERQKPNSGLAPDVGTVSVAPYGKGGRIFDWLPQALGDDAMVFYRNAFVLGFGVWPDLQGPPDIVKVLPKNLDIRGSELVDAKCEVSMGLAFESGAEEIISPSDKLKDFVGERGYTFRGQEINEWDDVDPEQLEQIGGNLQVPASFERLGVFAEHFEKFVEKHFERTLNTKEIMAQMALVPFVQTDPEFRRAKNQAREKGKFDFQTPLIVLEAMCFLEELKKRLF